MQFGNIIVFFIARIYCHIFCQINEIEKQTSMVKTSLFEGWNIGYKWMMYSNELWYYINKLLTDSPSFGKEEIK